MIPNIIHAIWFAESGEPPDYVEANQAETVANNTAAPMRPYSDGAELLPKWRPAWDHREPPDAPYRWVARSDLLRWSILEKCGGWYLDADAVARKPLAQLWIPEIGKRLIVPPRNMRAAIDGWVMGCEPGCPVWPSLAAWIDAKPHRAEMFPLFQLNGLWQERPELFHVLSDRDCDARYSPDPVVEHRIKA